jgi:hypothetical protein
MNFSHKNKNELSVECSRNGLMLISIKQLNNVISFLKKQGKVKKKPIIMLLKERKILLPGKLEMQSKHISRIK